jgi:hypothetical protein
LTFESLPKNFLTKIIIRKPDWRVLLMNRKLTCAFILAILVVLNACADMQTIGRKTILPGVDTKEGVAIHLDAQQRLLIARGAYFCAEPSPDALASYAASLGFGVSAPSYGAASVANAIQSSAGSIGLRTQSITLMRDALYRMCEAYMNGYIGDVQVATLLGRSQDLTAVVLAVEQLTGAVTANQIALTGTAGAASSANLISNQEQLDAFRKSEEEKKTDLDAAIKARDELQNSVTAKETEVKNAQAAFDQANQPNPKGDKTELEKDLNIKKTALNELKSNLDLANKQVDAKQKVYDLAKKDRETVEKIKDSAMTSASANAAGAGHFSNTAQRNQLSEQSTVEVAKAVEKMIIEVLNKDYTIDSCMSFVTLTSRFETASETDPRRSEKLTTQAQDLKKVCFELITASMVEKTRRIKEASQK